MARSLQWQTQRCRMQIRHSENPIRCPQHSLPIGEATTHEICEIY
ncbi:TPA: hypothetical protein N0F65_000878 [Lagenidium giganteum]|uniref:Uncharacterized protein n=1 Tax=Lagenidium giganteum TaxID=4803 RepID=A0AAV2Z058_9STRA|nr:TPA: hypothetical protein N0F65_000878 [Lagenidium giganteum]